MRRALFVVGLLAACGKAHGNGVLDAQDSAAGAGGAAASAAAGKAAVAAAGSGTSGGDGSGEVTSGSPTQSDSGAGGEGGAPSVPVVPALNYAVTGSWPTRPVALATKTGALKYTKIKLDDRFLAESCAIGDYNNDGLPDVSSGRRWYEQKQPLEGPSSSVPHVFRDGHEELPRAGAAPELNTGVSDDRADYAVDVDHDGYPDIINISNPETPEKDNPNPAPAPQLHASAYWYQNPGATVSTTTANWQAHPMNLDLRGEQHGLGDVDGDGFPEIYGACKNCTPPTTRGYYQADAENPNALWRYHAVSGFVAFPYGGLGKLHGEGFGDVNGDGKLDLLDRDGAWIDIQNPMPNTTACPAEGCGWIQHTFYNGLPQAEAGGSHMFAADFDGDGDADVVSADWAHGENLAWYEQTAPGTFARHQFMGGANDKDKYGVYFTEPHALEVADMDGDGIPDIVTGKTHLSLPFGWGTPDAFGDPVLYVFHTIRKPDANGSPVTFEPILIDKESGIGFQIAVGHVNTDGILDLCIASKLGLYLFLGQ